MRKHLQLAAAILCIATLTSSHAATPTGGDSYRLGVDDKLRIKVYEWRNSVGEVHEWSALIDEFTVGPSGDLSLPLIGSVPAAGKTTEALAEAIADRLQSAVSKRPLVSVEIAHYRPFYIVGTVNHPGEYPYRPGLTVLQALGIAGGLFRLTETGMLQFQRSAQTTAGDLRVLALQRNRLVARRARLQAELDGGNEVKFPPELTQRQPDPEIAAILKQEQEAFTAYRDGLQTEIASRNQLKDLLAKEVVSLQQKIASADREVGMLNGELTKVAEFVRKGLAVAPREFSLRQNGLEMQRARLDLDTAVLRAREEIGKTDQSIVELRNQTRKEVLREIDDTATKLTEVSAKIGTLGEIVKQDEATMPEIAASQPNEGTSVIYTIVRREDTGPHEVEASEMTPVQPGDTIRVRRRIETPIASGARIDPSANSALLPHAQPALVRARPWQATGTR
jgi:polysaccharide export outer membrane protein/exopolysaccharide production protein ExoF